MHCRHIIEAVAILDHVRFTPKLLDCILISSDAVGRDVVELLEQLASRESRRSCAD